jgi:hypothetical protein
MAILRHKFKAKPCVADGIKFSSKKEHKRYQQLKILQNSGEILFFLRQVPFHLQAGVKYVCDFVVFWTSGEVTIEDVKGMKTDMYILKKKMVEATYPITITEI